MVGTVVALALAVPMAYVAGLWDRCAVLVSPVWGMLEPAAIADYLLRRGLDRARLQVQLHKVIWPDADRGV